MKINVGCGRNIMPGWVNLDSMDLPGVDIVSNLDNAAIGDGAPRLLYVQEVEHFLLSHVLEHFKNPLGVMQELWTAAADGATMEIRCPHGASDDADEDPTHVRRMFPGSFGYFGQPYYWRADYGYRGDWRVDTITLRINQRLSGLSIAGRWEAIASERNTVDEMIVRMTAIKPIREPKKELQVWPQTLLV